MGVFPKLRRSRPADWGVGMTVCIAAICESGKGIVMAVDMMISMGWVSGDVKAAKNIAIAQNWNAMFSGGDISPVEPIISNVKNKLTELPADVLSVTKAFKEAYQEQLRIEASDRVLARYGWKLDSFLKDGYRALGPRKFADIQQKYEAVKLECDFLVCGFDSEQNAHIFTVSDPGICNDRSHLGFWAIGSGEYMALASLMSRERFIATRSAEMVSYYVCEAKFMAELASGVGKTTLLIGRKFQPTGEELFTFMIGENILRIRQAWLDEVKGREPAKIEQVMKSSMKWESRMPTADQQPEATKS